MHRKFFWLALTASLLFSSRVSAGGFVSPAGSVFTKLAYQSWVADEKFAGIFDRDQTGGVDLGDPIPFDPSTRGETTTQSLSLTLSVVPIERLEVGAYFPFYQISEFEDLSFASKTVGTGDLFLNAAYGIVATGNVRTKLAVAGKIPLTRLPVEFQAIPLGDGQVDLSIGQETTWAPIGRLHLTFGALFRKRFPFKEDDRTIKFGDEFALSGEVGGAPLSWIWIKAGYHGLLSLGTEDRSGPGASTLSGRRQVHDVTAGAYIGFGKFLPGVLSGLAVDANITYPIAGQDYPIGLTWAAGIAYSADLW